MKDKRSLKTAAALLLCLFCAFSVYCAVFADELPGSIADITLWADRAVKKQLSAFEGLNRLAPEIMLATGAKEQDGIFISQDYLLENISEPDTDILENNLHGIESFLDNHSSSAAFVLVPTACAIKQQDIPQGATLFNQKALISECYGRLSGRAASVDAYSNLFAAKEQYTYHRTETSLTGLGGYYVYTALATRLGFSPRPLNQFEMENLPQDYYGELYERCSYKGTAPDLITLYRFSRFSRQYKLSIVKNGEAKSYYTLFPTHLATLGEPQSVVLGGLGEITDISVVSPYEDSLLILADDTAAAYLPFLVVHYGDVTIVDISSCTEQQLSEIDADSYDQILFSYSVDSFIHKDVCSSAEKIG